MELQAQDASFHSHGVVTFIHLPDFSIDGDSLSGYRARLHVRQSHDAPLLHETESGGVVQAVRLVPFPCSMPIVDECNHGMAVEYDFFSELFRIEKHAGNIIQHGFMQIHRYSPSSFLFSQFAAMPPRAPAAAPSPVHKILRPASTPLL